MLLASMFLSMGLGAVSISPGEIWSILCRQFGWKGTREIGEVETSVLLFIRLPRILLGCIVGASLAIAGAAMQGLFRNPLADPGLIGISSGASMSAVLWIIIGHSFFGSLQGLLSSYALSVFAFLGALLTSVVVYQISRFNGRTLITTMLLAGIAVNALTSAVTGLFTFSANDAQLRSITFWMLGSIGGATWTNVLGILPLTILPIILLQGMGKALNAFSLGEHAAAHLGLSTERVKRYVILLSTLCVGASVAVSGVIGFVGLVVPHLVRIIAGPDYRHLLRLSVVTGMILVTLADLLARTMLAPVEVPIGIITSLTGAPFFLYILIKDKKSQKLI